MKMTRSRSQSASTERSSDSTSSNSSSSASSGSSSSSSSGSGSDSSSSDSEASHATKASQTSQRSRRSNSTTKSKATDQRKMSGVVRNLEPITVQSSSNFVKARSGSVSSSKSTTVNVPPVTKLAQRTFTRKKNLAASSSDSENTITTATRTVKRVGSKPPTVSIITTKSGSITNLNPIKKISPASGSTSSTATIKSSSQKKSSNMRGNHVSSTTKCSKKSSILKSIFSDNSSEESEPNALCRQQLDSPLMDDDKVGKASVSSVESKPCTTTSNRKSPTQPSSHQSNRQNSSSALSGTGSSTNTSTDDTSSASSSESEKKLSEGRDSSPKSPSSSQKRPVTRRRTVKSKTIPTTTMFTESVIAKSPPTITHWGDSDYSASADEHEARILTRVPAKTSIKPHPRQCDADEFGEQERKCPFPTCDSSGHLSGKYCSHSLLTTCPKYQGFSPHECKENADERRSRESERRRIYSSSNLHQKRPVKLSHEAKNWVTKMKDLKEKTTKDCISSEYDMSLWVDALSVAAGKIEEEQRDGVGYRSIAVGKFEMSCWCESPYPEPLCHSRRLFICEFCLKPVQSGTVLRRHCVKCVWRHPPGDEIYRKERLSVWEVDGKSQKSYCQNLCLLAKCFLDHKTLYLDVDPFLFYVMTVADSQGCHLVGYFSKEKNSFLNYNVSCILTLPPYQRKGFGRLLIDFSYLLTRVEGKVGSPEKPLSDLGLISYRSYWKDAVLRRMCACATKDVTVKDLSIELGITTGDLISTLQFLGMLKYWKGKHIVLKKQDVLEEYLERVRRRGEVKQIDPACLRWRPFQPTVESSC